MTARWSVTTDSWSIVKKKHRMYSFIKFHSKFQKEMEYFSNFA